MTQLIRELGHDFYVHPPLLFHSPFDSTEEAAMVTRVINEGAYYVTGVGFFRCFSDLVGDML